MVRGSIYIYIYLKGAYKYLNGAYYILKGYHSSDNCCTFVVFCPEINNTYILHCAVLYNFEFCIKAVLKYAILHQSWISR